MFLCRPEESERLMKTQTELQRLSEEDSNRARLPGGGRKKASEEPEINMQGWVISKRARHERVSRKMIRAMEKQMYATMTAEMRSLLWALVGLIVSSAATTSLAEDKYCPEGCQRIHAGEVCDIFIWDFCEEGIKRLVPNRHLVC